MKLPFTVESLDRLPRVVLVTERWVRTHPLVVGLFTVASVAAIGLGQIYMAAHGPTPLTYAFPLAVCSYGLGLFAGVIAAIAVGALWLLDAMNHGVPQSQANLVMALRVFSNLVIVALAAIASAAARAREEYLEAQEQLGTLRSDLVSAFSHDLRSPLTAITGYTEMVRDNTHDAATIEILDRVLANATQLDRLIGDMLTAGNDHGTAPLDVSTFAPQGLIDELRAEFDGSPRTKEVALDWRIDPQTPPLRTDRTKLASVVRNLVNNALKFTTSGSVVVRIGTDPATGAHRIEVEDTGPGIAPEAVPHVFDRFYRARGTQSIRGFGLGLFIVRRFAELLGGTVTVTSQLDRGTCFTVTIPRPAPPPLPDRAAH
jgi:signal transduction histidine kinase